MPLARAFGDGAVGWRDLGQPLEGVYIDTGENGLFARDEFATITALGQMEFITPEEVADYVVFELEGRPTGRDIVAALDSATAGPTYRAGILRAAALERLDALEREQRAVGRVRDARAAAAHARCCTRRYLCALLVPSVRGARGRRAAGAGRAGAGPDPSGRGAARRIRVGRASRSSRPDGRRRVPRGDGDRAAGAGATDPLAAAPRGWVDLRPASSGCGSGGRRRWCARRKARPGPERGASGSDVDWTAIDPDCADRPGGIRHLGVPVRGSRRAHQALAPMSDLGSLERCLGAIGTAFRLVRYYPPTHPAVQEAMRLVASNLPGVAAMGTVEWKVGATGMHWRGLHVLPRNAQLSELASLLFARGVRGIQLHPGATPDHIVALYGVATGTTPPDDASLGRVSVQTNRRTAAPRPSASAHLYPTLSDRLSPSADAPKWQRNTEGRRSSAMFRPDALPPDVESRRLVGALLTADSPEGLRESAGRLQELVPSVLELRDIALVAEILAGLDRALSRITDEATVERLGAVGESLAEPMLVERMVSRLGEPRIPPTERGYLVGAVGALATVTVAPLLRAYLSAPAELREPYRAAIRAAADRAMEPLELAIADPDATVVATAAHFMGLTGSPEAIPLAGGPHAAFAGRSAGDGALRHGRDRGQGDRPTGGRRAARRQRLRCGPPRRG